ncbi:MAG: hypothetical protein HOJ52_01075 [Candidatus Thioglobus sp.]|jgi:hypothetical protein|nr:hypothetical protein [Candidatus Thioglobus sp.]
MKKIMPILLLIFFALTLSGCGGSGINYKSTTEDVGARTTASYDSYKKLTTIRGPRVDISGALITNLSGSNYYFIRAWKYKSGEENYQIYVSKKHTAGDYYGVQGYKNYYSATNSEGSELKFTKIDSDFDVSCYSGTYSTSCSKYYREDFGIDLSRQDVNAGLQNKIDIKVYSKSGGNFIINISPNYINAILDKIDVN